ncbi:MAG: hypothetical protein ACJATN_001861 [Neolewinella sp.]|jgi:hypothetical protein|nr:hypothetical protein [Lewinella sp.]
MKNLGFNSPYALAGLCFAVVSISISTFFDFTIKSAPTNPLSEYVVEDVRGARERPEWMPRDLHLEEETPGNYHFVSPQKPTEAKALSILVNTEE